jgi:hypothetical protein
MPSSRPTMPVTFLPAWQPLPVVPAWQPCPTCGSVCSLPRVCPCPGSRRAPTPPPRRPWWHLSTWWLWLRRSKEP